MQETQESRVQSLGWEDPLQEKMATHSNPMNRKAWWAAVYGVAESDMTEHACMQSLFISMGEYGERNIPQSYKEREHPSEGLHLGGQRYTRIV